MFGEIAQKLRTAIFRGSGPNASIGDVPRPSLTADTYNFLREDATWSIPPYDPVRCDARLTLVSGDPFNVAGTTSGSTIYWTPCRGNRVWLYNSTLGRWNFYSLAETSIGVPAGTNVIDIFAYDNAGTPTLETLAWSNTTTRATALTKQDGVYVKSGAATRRYLGTAYTNGGSVLDSLTDRNLWNYYNRARKKMHVYMASNYSYTLGWRQVNADSTMRLAVVCGVQEEYINLFGGLFGFPNDSSYFTCGIGYDVTNASIVDNGGRTGGITNLQSVAIARLSHLTGVGLHNYNWLEEVALSGGTTGVHIFGNSPGSDYPNGLSAEFLC